MGKSSKISRSGMQGFEKQKKLAKGSSIHKQPAKPEPTKAKAAAKASSPKPTKVGKKAGK